MIMVALKPEQQISAQVEQCRRLASVLTMTRQMLVDAGNGEWEQVAKRELERREDLAACFSDPVPAADVELVAQAMAALLHLNEELMAKLKIARTEVMMLAREHTRG
ncbi:MAG: hypothetical protein KDI10_19045, partial [Halioglobus sp.]|nr:hypothetical protein [Halioglobus sp.]